MSFRFLIVLSVVLRRLNGTFLLSNSCIERNCRKVEFLWMFPSAGLGVFIDSRVAKVIYVIYAHTKSEFSTDVGFRIFLFPEINESGTYLSVKSCIFFFCFCF